MRKVRILVIFMPSLAAGKDATLLDSMFTLSGKIELLAVPLININAI